MRPVLGSDASRLPDLRGGSAYETIAIGRFVLAIEDVETLIGAGVMRFNSESGKFGFASDITSERSLQKALQGVPVQDTRVVKDLYRSAKVALPNGAAHTLTIPSGYGPAHFSNQRGGFALGLGIGGVSRVPYTSEADGGIGLGLSFGNAFETVGARVSLSFNDLTDIGNTDRISFGFELSRYLWDGLSVAIGGENLFVTVTDGEESYYAVASWAFDQRAGGMPFDGVLTLGVGSGRFAHKTPRDTFEGKGRDATRFFGALAWEITERTNLIADWNGRNLSIGTAFSLQQPAISVKLGIRDLTSNTGDGPRLTGSIGYTLARF